LSHGPSGPLTGGCAAHAGERPVKGRWKTAGTRRSPSGRKA